MAAAVKVAIGATSAASGAGGHGLKCADCVLYWVKGNGSVVSDIDTVGCLRSLRAHRALDGVSWVRSGSVEIAVGQRTTCYRIGAVICSLPWRRSARELGSTSCPVGAAMPV